MQLEESPCRCFSDVDERVKASWFSPSSLLPSLISSDQKVHNTPTWTPALHDQVGRRVVPTPPRREPKTVMFSRTLFPSTAEEGRGLRRE